MKIIFDDRYTKNVRSLTEKELEDLRRSMDRDCRINTPVIVDENGYLLDGYHRIRVMLEWFDWDESILIDPDPVVIPIHVLTGLTEEEKQRKAIELNWARRQLTKEEAKELVIKLYNEGQTPREISKETGVPTPTVYSHLRKSAKDGETEFSFRTDEEKLQIVREYLEGKSYATLMAEQDITQETLSRYIQWAVDKGFITEREREVRRKDSQNSGRTPDEKLKIVRAFLESKKTREEFASANGLSAATITNYLNWAFDSGYISKRERDGQHASGPKRILTNEQEQEVYELKQQGRSTKELSDLFGCTPSTINRSIKRHEGRVNKDSDGASENNDDTKLEITEKEASETTNEIDFEPWMKKLCYVASELKNSIDGADTLKVADKDAAIKELQEIAELLTVLIPERLV